MSDSKSTSAHESPRRYSHIVVVGLRGLIGAGKSTLAAAIQLEFPNVHVRSMAGPIKKGLAEMGITKTSNLATYRREAQRIGAMMRAEDPEWWVRLADTELARLNGLQQDIEAGAKRPKPPCIVIFDDIRYPNEAGLCDILHFVRPSFEVPEPLHAGSAEGHESEEWNLAYTQGEDWGCSVNPPTTLLVNAHNKIDDGAFAIMESVRLFIRTHP